MPPFVLSYQRDADAARGGTGLVTQDGIDLEVLPLNTGSGGGSLLVFPDIATMSAFDVTNLSTFPDGTTAVVESNGSYWYLFTHEGDEGVPSADGITIATATDSTPSEHRFWLRWAQGKVALNVQQVTWSIDPVAGNDEAAGTALAPLKTWGELTRRLGGNGPNLGAFGILVTIVSSLPSSDPVAFAPRIAGGGQAVLNGTPVPGASFAAGVVTVKNAAATPGVPWQVATWPVGAPTGTRIFNSTKHSLAWVRTVTAGTATLTQPIIQLTQPNVPAVVEDNTWVAGDTLVPLTLPTVFLQQWDAISSSENAGATLASVGWVSNIVLGSFDGSTTGTGADTYGHGSDSCAAVLYGCQLNPRLVTSSRNGRGTACYVVDCTVLRAQHFAGSVSWNGGQVGSFGGGGSLVVSSGFCTLTNDVATDGPVTNFGLLQSLACNSTGGVVNNGMMFLGAGFGQWGTGGINGAPGSTCSSQGAQFSTCYTSSGALTFGAVTTGTTYAATVFTDGSAINPTTIHTNGSVFDVKTGARFTELLG